MRGKVLVLVVEDLHSGITPAYAGKRSFLDLHPNPVWDHPRVCGEKVWRDVKRAAKAGSPPRMRGKDNLNIPVYDDTGITPAYAGKSFLVIPLVSSAWDHPRVCGEKLKLSGRRLVNLGSPPRMRGKGADFRS